MSFRKLTVDEIGDIMSCLEQFTKNTTFPTQPFVISIWEADIANQILKSNTEVGSYAIILKMQHNYANPINIQKINKIWNAGFVPIEIAQMTGAYFFALPKEQILNKRITSVFLPAEDENPKLEDFENIVTQ